LCHYIKKLNGKDKPIIQLSTILFIFNELFMPINSLKISHLLR